MAALAGATRGGHDRGMRILPSGSRLTCLVTLALAFAAPAFADTLIDNVNGISLDESGRVVRFSGLVMGDDGKVVRLVTAAAPLPQPVRKPKRAILLPIAPITGSMARGGRCCPG